VYVSVSVPKCAARSANWVFEAKTAGASSRVLVRKRAHASDEYARPCAEVSTQLVKGSSYSRESKGRVREAENLILYLAI
jgi:hypothetical protein